MLLLMAGPAAAQMPLPSFVDVDRHLNVRLAVAEESSRPAPSGRPGWAEQEEPGGGAGPESLARISERVAAGETVLVRTTGGDEVAGAFVAASPHELTVLQSAGVRRFAESEVLQVISGRRTSLWRRGLLIGLGAGALAGALECSSDSRPWQTSRCAGQAALGIAFGGGLGSLIGSRVSRDKVLYGPPEAPPGRPPFAGLPDRDDAVHEVIARRVRSLSELRSVAKPLDVLYVRTTDGRSDLGRFIDATDAALNLEMKGQLVTLSAKEVEQVSVRGRRMWRRGMLIGGLAGGTVATAAVLLTADTSEEREWALFLGTAGAAWGLGIGTAIGAFAFERQTVYEVNPPPTVRVSPSVGGGRIGLQAALTF